MSKDVLIVDDEIGIRELLSEILYDEGYRVHLAENAAQARAFRDKKVPDLVLLDIWMPETDGVTLLKEWAEQGLLTMPVIMMSGHGTIETAVEATRIGAVDYLEKPITLKKLLSTVAAAIQNGMRRRETATLTTQFAGAPAESGATPGLPGNILDLPLRKAREIFETAYFEHHLKTENSNITRIADKVGLERTHLYRKLKQLGIKVSKRNEEE